jgi:hypothetical protein
MQLFAFQWALGGGHPMAFHAVNLLLAAATAFAFWRLASRLLSEVPAFLAAALFAVHPVHVEVTGNVVGQAELLASLFAILAIDRYIHWRERGALSLRQRGALAVLTLAAILSKETGYVTPALLLTAEWTVVRAGEPLLSRIRTISSAYLLQAATVVGAILWRIVVLGPTPGATATGAMVGLPAGERLLAMLGVVPHWVRLLLWPSHLQAEYGPPQIPVGAGLHAGTVLGLLLLVSWIALLLLFRRRAPVVTLGLSWIGVALLPVSNLLATTGVLLAERTLFLPSAGAMIALGAVGAAVFRGAADPVHRFRTAVVLAAVGLLVLVGVLRSAHRQETWQSQDAFFAGLIVDASRTARAQRVASEYYWSTSRPREAEQAARRAIDLSRRDPKAYEHLGQLLRVQGRCVEAVEILDEGVRLFPDETVIRARMIECALKVGDTARAVASAREALAMGQRSFELTLRRLDLVP